ncbi:MAG TPA: T9SS type A sorting domain-containing protein [Bacteroidales bacterium]|nr:T9SS type A sorting domain-containing protein [Bacteroidales bacterium]
MRRFLFFIALINLFNFNCLAQCSTPVTKIMVLGDSWAFLSWSFNSYNENLDRYGFTDVRANSNANISINGAKARNYFSDPATKTAIINFLASNPDIEFCHISLGGNDILGDWNDTMTAAVEDSLIGAIVYNLKKDIDTIRSLKPGLKFLISGYDYPNFVETAGLNPNNPYYGNWTDMGQPDALKTNTVLAKLTQCYVDSAAAWDDVSFVNNNGLMQWIYGQTIPLTVPPFGTYPPHSVLLPGGEMNYPSPKTAMTLFGNDAFHLDDVPFEYFIQRHFEKYYWFALRNPDVFFVAGDTLSNGNVTAATFSTDVIKTGKSAGDEIHGIVSFNTSSLNPSLDIASASIFLNRHNLSGFNLAGLNLTLEIKKGFFGAGPQVGADDFSCSGDTSLVACTFGTVENNGYWFRIDVPEALLPFINKSGYTQFKLKYNDAGTDNYFEFRNFTDTLSLPILDIWYDFSTSVSEYGNVLNVLLYPNPATDYVHFCFDGSEVDGTTFVELVNSNGRAVLRKNFGATKGIINTSDLPAGIYYLMLTHSGRRCCSKIAVVR